MNNDPAPVDVTMAPLPPASTARGGRRDRATDSLRRDRAVSMRIAGLTYQQIAAELGYNGRGAAQRVVVTALAAREAVNVDEMRAVENRRLDRAQAAIWPLVIGSVEGDHSVDDVTRLRAATVFVRLSARRAKMNGLEAPVQIGVSTTTRAELEAALADLRDAVTTESKPWPIALVPDEVAD